MIEWYELIAFDSIEIAHLYIFNIIARMDGMCQENKYHDWLCVISKIQNFHKTQKEEHKQIL